MDNGDFSAACPNIYSFGFDNPTCFVLDFPPQAAPASNGSANNVFTYIQDFCTPEHRVTVTPDESLTRKWTIESNTLEIAAEIDTSKASCQHATFSIGRVDQLCEQYLSQIVYQCGVQYVHSSFRGYLVVDECKVWASRALTASQFREYARKGLGYIEHLESVLARRRRKNRADLTDELVAAKYQVKWERKTSDHPDDEYLEKKFGIPDTEEFFDVDAVSRENDELYYHNYFNPPRGMIFAFDNEGVGLRERWSQMAWHFWVKACLKYKGISPSSLSVIIQNEVKNEETLDVLEEAAARAKVGLARAARKETMWTPEMTFDQFDEEFYAIIGTPNGKGAAWLLIDNAATLGKTITRITAFGRNVGSARTVIWRWEIIFYLDVWRPVGRDRNCIVL
ncbi:hypothetical protein NUU61_009761 [Penicillium alfredii]|uniref:Uncharacterized protein n=1 Tax=Penicillium alfredii TaxID=1506179 RepID=A0A9W9JUB4_9EURO|nr:uncharacterized protein NUU61_009761 [Penicillium alfredii]KAJ5081497.1 hypothetical protein NUU61_009761 [Penicillium alfredii]